MKAWPLILLVVLVAILAVPMSIAGQTATPDASVPKYDARAETTFRGTVVEIRDRVCPVSGGLGSHIVIKMSDGKTIEAHLASTRFVNNYSLIFHKGEEVEIVGTKVMFEGVETIFAREVRRGQDVFMFRDKKGNPIW